MWAPDWLKFEIKDTFKNKDFFVQILVGVSSAMTSVGGVLFEE